jgi:hypothetical protein
MELATTQASAPVAAYRIERVELNQAGPAILREWQEFLERTRSHSPINDPQWLRHHFGEGKGDVSVYFLYQKELLCGLAPFFIRPWPMKWQVGEVTLSRLPLRRLCLLSNAVRFPSDPSAYELLFREILSQSAHFDAIYLEDLPCDSDLWRFIESDQLITRNFSRYISDAPSPHILLRLEGTFEDYLGKFSAKHRKNLKRSIRLFEEQAEGDVRVARYTGPESVDEFVEQAAEISRRTYQWQLLGLGLRSSEEIKEHLRFMAHQGWLRSYILLSKDKPCAFVITFQYGESCYLNDMGYDPDWRDFSVGKILQLEIIKDLYKQDQPRFYDLGEYGPHKEEIGNESYLQGKMLLFRRGMYPLTVRAGHRVCNFATAGLSAVLERFGWKKRLKKLIRIWSSRS